MRKLKLGTQEHQVYEIRKDRQRSTARLTKAGYSNNGGHIQYAERTGDWEKWWREGCGLMENGKPWCPPGHAYYIEKNGRKSRARDKIRGRRKDRRKNNRLTTEE